MAIFLAIDPAGLIVLIAVRSAGRIRMMRLVLFIRLRSVEPALRLLVSVV
jgi:hypothetical protein